MGWMQELPGVMQEARIAQLSKKTESHFITLTGSLMVFPLSWTFKQTKLEKWTSFQFLFSSPFGKLSL